MNEIVARQKKPNFILIDLFVRQVENEMNRQKSRSHCLGQLNDQLIILFILLSNVNSFILITHRITYTLSMSIPLALVHLFDRLICSAVCCLPQNSQPAVVYVLNDVVFICYQKVVNKRNRCENTFWKCCFGKISQNCQIKVHLIIWRYSLETSLNSAGPN